MSSESQLVQQLPPEGSSSSSTPGSVWALAGIPPGLALARALLDLFLAPGERLLPEDVRWLQDVHLVEDAQRKLAELSHDELLEVICAAERARSRAYAQQLRLITILHARRPIGTGPTRPEGG